MLDISFDKRNNIAHNCNPYYELRHIAMYSST